MSDLNNTPIELVLLAHASESGWAYVKFNGDYFLIYPPFDDNLFTNKVSENEVLRAPVLEMQSLNMNFDSEASFRDYLEKKYVEHVDPEILKIPNDQLLKEFISTQTPDERLMTIEILILVVWHKAHKHAEDNAKLLILNHALFGELCKERMGVCTAADSLLYGIEIRESLPIEVTRHLKAEKDKGCTSCWISSLRGKRHPECQKKMNEWWDSREGLWEYIEKNYLKA